MRARILAALLLLTTHLLSPYHLPLASATAAEAVLAPGICFSETGKCVRGLFYAYWVANGGLSQQGFPLTDEFMEKNPADGKMYRVQYFERARFEYHPEKVNTPFVVLLGLLGRDQLEARYPQGGQSRSEGKLCFPEATGQCISGSFLDYWQQKGGLAQFGYPLTGEFEEASRVDGQTRPVQYFERARFEFHPEKAGTPFAVLLGLIGREIFEARYPQGQPTPVNPAEPAVNIYANALTAELDPRVAAITARVYVPNENGGNVDVIDPATFQVVDRFAVGNTPHHATPAWDMTRLHINNMGSSNLTEIEPRSARPVRSISIPVPYNLYYTLDGTKAIVAAEPANRLDFYNPQTWQLIRSVYIPYSGVDHMDMSADGRYLLASTEYSGIIVKVDTVRMEISGLLNVGGLPVDVRSSPDGSVFYVANQARQGVSIIDPVVMKEIGFVPTGTGAHGMHVSRDARSLYVSNRLNGTISVIDFESRAVRETWKTGGSPDMLQISPDGKQLWASGRFNGVVYVVDTTNGQLIRTIPVGQAPHGIAYFPQPGRFSLGHNGVYR